MFEDEFCTTLYQLMIQNLMNLVKYAWNNRSTSYFFTTLQFYCVKLAIFTTIFFTKELFIQYIFQRVWSYIVKWEIYSAYLLVLDLYKWAQICLKVLFSRKSHVTYRQIRYCNCMKNCTTTFTHSQYSWQMNLHLN